MVTLRYLYFNGKMIVLEDACRGYHLLARGGVWMKHTDHYMKALGKCNVVEEAKPAHRRVPHAYVIADLNIYC